MIYSYFPINTVVYFNIGIWIVSYVCGAEIAHTILNSKCFRFDSCYQSFHSHIVINEVRMAGVYVSHKSVDSDGWDNCKIRRQFAFNIATYNFKRIISAVCVSIGCGAVANQNVGFSASYVDWVFENLLVIFIDDNAVLVSRSINIIDCPFYIGRFAPIVFRFDVA